jgi:hypothetical protein
MCPEGAAARTEPHHVTSLYKAAVSGLAENRGALENQAFHAYLYLKMVDSGTDSCFLSTSVLYSNFLDILGALRLFLR